MERKTEKNVNINQNKIDQSDNKNHLKPSNLKIFEEKLSFWQ